MNCKLSSESEKYTFWNFSGYQLTNNCNVTAENPEGKKKSFLIARIDNESKSVKRYIVINEDSKIRTTEQVGKDANCAINHAGEVFSVSKDGACDLDGLVMIGI